MCRILELGCRNAADQKCFRDLAAVDRDRDSVKYQCVVRRTGGTWVSWLAGRRGRADQARGGIARNGCASSKRWSSSPALGWPGGRGGGGGAGVAVREGANKPQ